MPRRLHLLLLTLLFLVSCVSGGGGSSDDGSSSSANTSASSNTSNSNFKSSCGAVSENQLLNPVEASNLDLVSVELVSSDSVIVNYLGGQDVGGRQFIKFHSVSDSSVNSALRQRGLELLRQKLQPQGYLLRAGTACPAFDGGAEGILGQLFTTSGENINELLLQSGAVNATSDSCGGNLLASCYQGLESSEEISSSTIKRFLWKPVSERDGNLVVLVDAYNVRVVVSGAISETLDNTGPSNGYGTTARANRTGSAYGGNITVEFFDLQNRRILIGNGNSSITVANGSQRVESRF